MKVLVINAGSSSCKYQLLEMDNESVLASGLAERIGQGMGCLTHKIAPDSDKAEKIVKEAAFPTHVEAMELVISLLTDPEKGVIKDKSEIFAIGHRVLHGGEDITRTVKVDDNVKKIIRDNFLLGPLHNPANLMGIEVAEKLFPGTASMLTGSHVSAVPGHAALMEQLGIPTYLDLGMRLGEGTGAVLLFPVIDTAVRILTEMPTLDSLDFS